MAIWRRKLTIPISLRAHFGDAIRERKEELQREEMVIRIDECEFYKWFADTCLSAFSIRQEAPARRNKLSKEPPKRPKKKWFRWAT
jgi:hypothetical protein